MVLSTINLNIAEGGVYNPGGGAMYLDTSAAEIADCELLENVVRGGAYGNGGTAPQSHRLTACVVRARPSFMQEPCSLTTRH